MVKPTVSLPVKASRLPPMVSTSRAICEAEREVVPLKTMCSTKWEIPFWAGVSSRDPEFTKDFLKRHQNKLIFGSDCSCIDGKGGGISQGGNPGASRLAGKCVARETLTLLKTTVSQALFHKLAWENAHKTYRLKT